MIKLPTTAVLVFAVALLMLPIRSRGDMPTSQPAAPVRINEAALVVTRTDVARAFLSFERLLHDNPVPEAQQPAVNREFDALANNFAMRRHAATVRELHALSDTIAPNAGQTPQSPEAKVARAMRVRISPSVASTKRPSLLRVRISPLYAIEMDHSVKLHLTITQVELPAGLLKPIVDRDFEVQPGGMAPVMTIEQPADLDIGHYRVELIAPDGYHVPVCDWFVTDQLLEMDRQTNQQNLRIIGPDSTQLWHALTAVSARNGLLSDQISESDASRLLVDPVKLSGQVSWEIGELQHDRDPFVDRAGDYWRTITLGTMQVPARVYAPAAATSGKKVPLVIALHGAGGDENLFMEGYGLGEIKRQADKYGFLLVTPRTDFAILAPDPIEQIVTALGFDYLIDRSRVFVIGHSLGAIAAQKWSQRFGDKLAGVVQMSGATPFAPAGQLPPTLLFAGELDPIFPAARLAQFAADAKKAGLAVEFRAMKARGHTLYVNEVLPQAVEWLMKLHPSQVADPSPTTTPSADNAPPPSKVR